MRAKVHLSWVDQGTRYPQLAVQLKRDGAAATTDVERPSRPQRGITERLPHKVDKLDMA